jgi:O-antigen/teichoic acid export membrane protein
MFPFDENGAFRPVAHAHDLRRLAVRGAAASVSASAVALGAQVISTVILARLLAPSDFGVVAMATTFSLFLASFGLNGFTEAVIQFEEIDEHTVSNLFWLNTGAGLVLGCAFFEAGSLLGSFYHNPVVANVAKGLSVGIVIAAGSVIHLALLKRAMCFTATSTNDVLGRAINTAVAIVLALRGWGYWALVGGIVAQQTSVTLGAWWLCRWVPSVPRATGRSGSMIRFSAKVYGQFTFAYAAQNVDNLLVGWRFNAGALGYYKRAFDLFALTASQLTSPLNNVALAALSRLNQDPARFRRYLASSLGMIAFIGMAVSADLTLVGRNVVRLVLGAKWSESGRIFEIFAPGIGAMLLCSTIGWIHLSIGKPGRWMRYSLVALAFTASSFVIALHWGPAAVAGAWSISYWILLLPSFWYAGQPVGFKAFDLFCSIWRYTAAALVAGSGTYLISRLTTFWGTQPGPGDAFVAILFVSALFTVLYLGMVIIFHGGIAPLSQFTNLLRDLSPAHKVSTQTVEVAEG